MRTQSYLVEYKKKLRAVKKGKLQLLVESSTMSDVEAKFKVDFASKSLGHQGVLELWKKFSTIEFICWRSAREMRNFVVKSDEAKKFCIEKKLEELLLQSLIEFPSSQMCQSQCLRLLGTLVYQNDVMRRKCGERGVVPLTCAVLDEHANDEQVSRSIVIWWSDLAAEERSAFTLAKS